MFVKGLLIVLLLVELNPCESKAWIPKEVTTDIGKSSPKINFFVKEVNSVVEEKFREVPFGVSWGNDTATLPSPAEHMAYILVIVSENPKIMEVVNSSNWICLRPDMDIKNYTFTVKGVFLGFTKAKIIVLPAPSGCDVSPESLDVVESVDIRTFEIAVSVVRKYSVLVDVVTGIMASLVAFNFVNMGVQLDLHCIGKVLKKPVGPSIGFVCQFLFMPLASYGISYLLLEDVSLRLGLFTLGCSPGGSMSNFWTLLFKGDVNLSVTMTFISTIAALAMMPLWIFTLGRTLFRNNQATIPYMNLAGSLIILTIPLGLGLLIQQYSPRFTRLSKKIIKPITLICVAFGIFVGLYANSFVFLLFTWKVVLAGLSIAWGGYFFGAFMAWIFRLERSQIIAVSIETAFQNPAVAFVMLLMSLPQPEADLSAVPVIAQLMLTGLPMWILFTGISIYKRVKKVKGNTNDSRQEEDYVPISVNPPTESVNNNDKFTSAGNKS